MFDPQALLISTGVVALAEIGDKTQLLSLVLAARYGRPVPIIAGILVATLANHWLAALAGSLVAGVLGPEAMRWIVGLSFLAVAAWTLVPDRFDEAGARPRGVQSVFWVTVIAFFIAEMGDKTQVATVLLAAEYPALAMVVIGTTAGMLLANVPVVLAGQAAAGRLPLRAIRWAAALLFAAIGIAVLVLPD